MIGARETGNTGNFGDQFLDYGGWTLLSFGDLGEETRVARVDDRRLGGGQTQRLGRRRRRPTIVANICCWTDGYDRFFCELPRCRLESL